MADRPFASVKTFLLILVCVAVWLTVAFFGFGCGPVRPPAQPKLPVFDEPLATRTCQAIWSERCTTQEPAPARVLTSCVEAFRRSVLLEANRDLVSATEECIKAHTQPTGPTTVRGRLHFDTKARYADGTEFAWMGITAFGLLEQVAHGRQGEATAWMKARRAQGFTLVRTLAMNHGWLNLPPADGRAALPRFLQLAKQEDLYVLIVALAGTADRPRTFLDDQVKAVGAICAASDNCLLELANEPYHSSQHETLGKPSTMAILRAKVPTSVPVTYGAPRADEPLTNTPTKIEGRRDDGTLFCGGNFVVLHRKRNAEIWDDLRRFTELQKVAKECGKYTVDDEGFGFAEVPQVGTNKRRTESYAGFGQGLLAHAFGLGSTFHCDACLLSTPLGPKQTAAAAEFIAGYRFIRSGVTLRFVNGKAGESAVKDASFIGPNCSGCAVLRGFSFFSPGYNLFTWVGLRPGKDPKPTWQNGWKPKTVLAERPGFQVLEIQR